MPTYEYRCAECGYEFEAFQQMSDRPKRKCPQCGRFRLHRLMGTGAGIIFKGSGFYETDYKRKASGGNSRPGASYSSGDGKKKKVEAPGKKEDAAAKKENE